MANPWESFTPGTFSDAPSQSQEAPPQQTDKKGPWSSFTPGVWSSDNSASQTQSAPQSQPEAPQQPVDDSWSNKGKRFAYGLAETPMGIAQGAAHLTGIGKETADSWANQLAQNEAQAKADAGLKPEDWDWWNTAGSIAPTLAVPEARIASAVGLGAKTIPSLVGRSALAGAAYNAAQPVTGDAQKDYASSKLEQTGMGALGAGATGLGIAGAARVVKPAIGAAAQKLIDAGVKLSPDQAVAAVTPKWVGNVVSRGADAAQSIPIVGGMIRGSREAAVNDFNVAAANKALDAIGESVPSGVKPGHELFNYVEDRLGQKYDDIHAHMGARLDTKFMSDVAQELKDARPEMSAAKFDQLQALVDNHIADRFTNNNALNGSQIQDITSKLKKVVRDNRFSNDADQRNFAYSADNIREAFEDMLGRQNPDQAASLKQANLGWAHLLRLERATANPAGGAFEGAFTPTRLNSADTQLAGRRQAARGNGLYQDLSEAGKQALMGRVADSGTPERLAVMGLLGGADYYTDHKYLKDFAIPAAVIAGAYSPVGQKAIRAAMLQRPAVAQSIRDILDKYGPSVAGRLPLLNNGNQ